MLPVSEKKPLVLSSATSLDDLRFVFRVHGAICLFFILPFVLFLKEVYPAILFSGLRKKSLGILPPCEAVSCHCFRQALQRLRFISWDEQGV